MQSPNTWPNTRREGLYWSRRSVGGTTCVPTNTMLTASLGQRLDFKRMSGCSNLTGSGFAELHTNVFNGRMSGENPELSLVRKEAQVAFNIAALTG